MIRGGGDLASGVVLRFARCGIQVIVTEIAAPLAVRRSVSFAQAVYEGQIQIEEVQGVRAQGADEINLALAAGKVPVLVDPGAEIAGLIHFDVVVDARMTKKVPAPFHSDGALLIGLGPGFTAGENCQAVIETKRGPFLGRVYWQGSAEPDSGLPDPVANHQADRVLRAPADGILRNRVDICSAVAEGEQIAEVGGQPVLAPFSGRLRGLLMDGLPVTRGLKIGDLDPRDDEQLCRVVSDKALSVGGGALEAVLSVAELRRKLSG